MEGVGVEKVITKSTGNIVYTIDDEPALDVYKRYFHFDKELDTPEGLAFNIGVQYPLLVHRKNGEVVIRAPILANHEDNSLIFAGAVHQGSIVQFSIPPNFDIVKKVIGVAENLQEENPSVDGLIMFSCKARHTALGPMIEEEIGGIYKLWQVPMVGFFSYGEFGSLSNSPSDFHNETCSLVLIKVNPK